MRVQELLLQLEDAVKANPDVLNYEIMTEGWCCGTSYLEIDDELKEINIS